MFENQFHSSILALMKRLFRGNEGVKDSALLQAYATMHAIKTSGISDLEVASQSVIGSYSDKYYRAIYQKFSSAARQDLQEIIDLFTQVPFADFLRFGIPGFVGDVDLTCKLLRHYFGENLLLSVQHIVQIKLTPFEMERTKKCQIVASDSYDDVTEKIYQVYCLVEENEEIKLSKDVFVKLYRAINQYPLDANELKPFVHPVGDKEEKSVYASILSLSKMGLSKAQQIEFLYRYFVKNKNNPRLIHEYEIYKFTQVKDEYERAKLLSNVMKSLAPIYPLESLCATLLFKRQLAKSSKSRTEDIICANDITLENGLIYSLFSSSVFDGSKDERTIGVFFPTPFFVRKWLNDSTLKKLPVTFVFKDKNVREILQYHYYNGTYAQRPGDNIRFVSYDSWQAQVEESGEIDFASALLYACDWDIAEQDRWYQLIKSKAAASIEIFALISSYEFENALSPFSAELEDSRISIAAVALIPQGINNSSSPRRKIFMRCTVLPLKHEDAANSATKIYAFTLNTDLKTQALSRMSDKPVEVPQQNLAGLYTSIRALFNDEMLKRRASGRSNIAAFSYEFSPDITIWCSKSYPKNNLARPRLEAYVCEPASQQKKLQGYMDRGEKVKQTCKRATRIFDNQISLWLEEEYPFSVMQARHTAEDLKNKYNIYSLKPAINIREEIINVYGPLLKGQDIAVKTLWYLHPNLEDEFSGDDFRLLAQIAKSELGYERLSELTVENCEVLLSRCFPAESQDRLWVRYRVLSAAVDRAVKYGYCESNPLQIAIQDRYVRDKLFAQVRRALVKKHFTLAEMIRAYDTIVQRIKSGQMEYIGVLIRLLTGMESNVVCALKVKNFAEIVEYGIYQLNVTCQLTNNGSEYKGFDRLEDYRNVPCMSTLADYLRKHIDKIKNILPEAAEVQNTPIVTTKAVLKKAKTRYIPYQPRELDRLCKEVVKDVGIEEHVIEIPSNDGGTKETNLNRYGGDFFRENFRHWALKAAKMELDEVQYILGNKPATTFGRFYYDYLNDASQLMMFVKLQRWDVILNLPADTIGTVAHYKKSKSIVKEVRLDGRDPLHLHIVLTLKQGIDEVTVTLSGKYGMEVFSVPIELVE